MAKSRSTVPLEKVTINLIEGDKHILSAFYPEKGWSVAAREIINNYCTQLRELESQQVRPETLKVKIEIPFLKEAENEHPRNPRNC